MTNLQPKQFGDRPVFTNDEDLVEAPLPEPTTRSRQFSTEGIQPGYSHVGGSDLGDENDDHARGFYRNDYEGGYGGMRSSHYEYKTGEGAGGQYTADVAAVVQHTPPSAHYAYDVDRYEKNGPLTPGNAAHVARAHSWLPDADKDLLRSMARSEPKLFGTSYVPGRSEVFSLFATKQAAIHAPTLLGVAARQTALETGRTLTPPDDLSKHSSRMVEHLKGAGAVDSAAPTEVTNDYEHFTMPEWSSTKAKDRIPDDEVARGRSTMRQVLRQGKPRKQRETYTQERLL